MGREKDLEKKIYSTFSEVASALGYSPLHGKIIAVLLVHDSPMSLQELARETGYSTGMLSLSLDLLEVLAVVKKVKKTGDRRLYVSMHGDLLECLKTAIIIKVRKSIDSSLRDFEQSKKQLATMDDGADKKSVQNTISVLENQLERLAKYIDLLAKIKLP